MDDNPKPLPMSDFDLDRSRWYCLMKLGLAANCAKNDAAAIIDRARKLGSYDLEPAAVKELADVEDALTEALFAVKVAREEYNNRYQLQAAE